MLLSDRQLDSTGRLTPRFDRLHRWERPVAVRPPIRSTFLPRGVEPATENENARLACESIIKKQENLAHHTYTTRSRPWFVIGILFMASSLVSMLLGT